MIIVLVTCKNKKEAQRIGGALLKKRLAGCAVVIPKVHSAYFWPPKTGKVVKASEAILLVKTLKKKFREVELEVKKLHSYSAPFIAEIPVSRVHRPYFKWLEGEVNGQN